MSIVEGELFSLEQEDGPYISVFGAQGRLRIVVGTTSLDDRVTAIDLDQLSAGRLRRAIDKWLNEPEG